MDNRMPDFDKKKKQTKKQQIQHICVYESILFSLH